MDVLTKEQRKRCMTAVRAKNTTPEILVRRAISSLGYRYRLHYASLPGKPDIVFPGMKKAIFVHGCFWHRHTCAKGRSVPQTNTAFWNEKLFDNVERDRRSRKELIKAGWRTLVIWQCQTRYGATLFERLRSFLAA